MRESVFGWLKQKLEGVSCSNCSSKEYISDQRGHSALNMFTEYSMVDQDVFEEYTRFMETEVKALCFRYNMDFEKASSWYDGYELINFHHVYNPKSVVEAMRRGRCFNY